MHDLAVIIVSHNDAHWLPACLETLLAATAGVDTDVVVVDSASEDGTVELVGARFPAVRTIRCANHGFGHGNNRGLETCDARWLLFLNPDTEVLEGSFAQLLARLDRRPEVGVAGVRQLRDDDRVHETIRYFPGALRAWGEALGAERWRGRWAQRFRERELDPARYERESACDWTQGSFVLVRREAFAAVGMFDERFFLYLEETDLCLRIRAAGWQTLHSPAITIRHHQHSGEHLPNSRALLQGSLSRTIYARKHFAPPRRAAYLAAHVAGVAIRALSGMPREWQPRERRRHVLRVLRTCMGREPAPYEAVPPRALH